MSQALIMETDVGADITVERQLETSGQIAVRKAREMSIISQLDYEAAGAYLVENKRRTKMIKDYWDPAKSAAKAAHQSIVDKEKAMLVPLTEAEGIVKGKMVQYQAAVERARREAEADMRRKQREETDRLLAAAATAADAGNHQDAAVGLAMAEMVEEMKPTVPREAAPKAAGTSIRTTWQARVIDETAVPAYVNGQEIRKINMAALNSIARMSHGTVSIPGVEFYEEKTIAARI